MFREFADLVWSIYGNRNPIPLHAPKFNRKTKQYLNDVIDSTFVSSVGECVSKFEKKISNYVGCYGAVATVNGTAALHASLLLSGVGTNDEVITQPLSFVATCNAISYCGAEPAFVDVESQTLGMCPVSLNEYLQRFGEIRDDGKCWNRHTNKIIKACVPMHTLGHPTRMSEIANICNEHGIALIEDAAEALGTFSYDAHVGFSGKAGVLSFNGNKIITTGGGGMILVSSKQDLELARHLTTTAKVPHRWHYEHDKVGHNYRMPNLNAALGLSQIEHISEYLSAKRNLSDTYKRWFDCHGIESIGEPVGARSNFWLNAILLPDKSARDEFLRYTNDNNIATRPLWNLMHTLDMYRHCVRNELKVAEKLYSSVVTLPSSVP